MALRPEGHIIGKERDIGDTDSIDQLLLQETNQLRVEMYSRYLPGNR